MDIVQPSHDHHENAVRAKLVRLVEESTSIREGEEGQYVSLLLLWTEVIRDLFLSWGVPSIGQPVYTRWMRKMASTSIRQLASSYGDVLDVLRRSENFSSFADTFEGYIARGVVRDLFIPLNHLMKWLPEQYRLGTVWFRLITQVVSFPFRANLDAPSLDEAWADYLRIDEECQDPDPQLVEELANAYSFLIDETGLDAIPFCPRHGPGAIMEWSLPRNRGGRRDLLSKYGYCMPSAIVAYAVSRYPGTHRDYGFPVNSTRLPCKFSPVPKSIGKTRTICIEPAGMQFFQQGLRGVLEDVIRQSPARAHIQFKDTARSVDMARLGSIDGSYSTVDLSNASDRIPYTLMRGAFAKSKLLPLLVACRSNRVRYKADTHILRKLYTSGSAACFPTETLIFTMMCQVAVWRTKRSLPRSQTKFDFSVYGDDIVISTPCIPALLEILALCGAKVNASKTFVDSSFTECCGHEFFKGVDVTPLRIPRKYNLWGLLNGAWYGDDIESFNQCIDLANKCYDYSLFGLRRTLIRAVFDRDRAHLNPAFGDTCIHTEWVVNDFLKKDARRTADYQRPYAFCRRTVSTNFVETDIGGQRANRLPETRDQSLDLLHWFVSSDLRPDDVLSFGSEVLERRAKAFSLVSFPRD